MMHIYQRKSTQRGSNWAEMCVICGLHQETTSHLFLLVVK